MGDDGPAASAEPSAGPTAAEYQASYGVFRAAFDVPTGYSMRAVGPERWRRTRKKTRARTGTDKDEDEMVGAGAAEAPTCEWAAGCAAWYVGHARAALPAPLARGSAAAGGGGYFCICASTLPCAVKSAVKRALTVPVYQR